jgi:hypothetical protein
MISEDLPKIKIGENSIAAEGFFRSGEYSFVGWGRGIQLRGGHSESILGGGGEEADPNPATRERKKTIDQQPACA